MRSEPDPEARPRLILGATMIALPALGLWHLWSGSPQAPADRQHAAGFAGFAIGGPLSDGLTAWIAAPLLFIGVLFGVLLITGTTIREVPATVRAMFGTRTFRDDDEYDEYDDDYDDEPEDAAAEDFSDGYYDRLPPARPVTIRPATSVMSRRRGRHRPARRWTTTRSIRRTSATRRRSPNRAPSRSGRSRPQTGPRTRRPQAGLDTLTLDRVVEGPYTLPPLDLLIAG